jgi:hypothetical protein
MPVPMLLNRLFFSFPIQLFFLHLKKNHGLLIAWLLLFAMVTGNLGRVFGIPYLFLDPEYLGESGFLSFMIMGLVIGGFIMAFHISSYILDGPRYSFLGTLKRPFSKFCVNNSLIPLIFLIIYVWALVDFQSDYSTEYRWTILPGVGGLFLGITLMKAFLFTYFRFTNKDYFVILGKKVDVKLKKVKITRVNIMDKMNIDKTRKTRVDLYFDEFFRIRETPFNISHFDRKAIIKVFDQNHLNSVIIEVFIFIVIILIGLYRDNPYFMIPAGASVVLLLTLLVMLGGAISFWFREWAATALILALFALNFSVKSGWLNQPYVAYGLDYQKEPMAYNSSVLDSIHSTVSVREDLDNMREMLQNWKSKNEDKTKPKLVILGSSGGGLRSALWNLASLQLIDSLSQGKLFDRTALITGASGGIIGATYFRELKYRQLLGEPVNPYAKIHQDKISSDLLNPIIFTLIVNDLFFIKQKFEYLGKSYVKERGYAFENQFNINTDNILNRPIKAYQNAEHAAQIPMLLLAPTIVNDGRKLFISAQPVSFLGIRNRDGMSMGIDFQRFFANHGAADLHFVTALRMNATFPYISPNVYLPTEPPMEIMDAGLSDNFGLSDAMDFILALKPWIEEHTSGVILLSIRDTERLNEVERQVRRSLFQKFTIPLSIISNNWARQQDLRNDQKLNYLRNLMNVQVERIELQYYQTKIGQELDLLQDDNNELLLKRQIERASLSWHLTPAEKEDIIFKLSDPRNREAIQKLITLIR